MRQHKILTRILLILSIINFVLAAPAAVRERPEIRLDANPTKNVKAAWQKRRDLLDESGSMNVPGPDHSAPPSPDLTDSKHYMAADRPQPPVLTGYPRVINRVAPAEPKIANRVTIASGIDVSGRLSESFTSSDCAWEWINGRAQARPCTDAKPGLNKLGGVDADVRDGETTQVHGQPTARTIWTVAIRRVGPLVAKPGLNKLGGVDAEVWTAQVHEWPPTLLK